MVLSGSRNGNNKAAPWALKNVRLEICMVRCRPKALLVVKLIPIPRFDCLG